MNRLLNYNRDNNTYNSSKSHRRNIGRRLLTYSQTVSDDDVIDGILGCNDGITNCTISCSSQSACDGYILRCPYDQNNPTGCNACLIDCLDTYACENVTIYTQNCQSVRIQTSKKEPLKNAIIYAPGTEILITSTDGFINTNVIPTKKTMILENVKPESTHFGDVDFYNNVIKANVNNSNISSIHNSGLSIQFTCSFVTCQLMQFEIGTENTNLTVNAGPMSVILNVSIVLYSRMNAVVVTVNSNNGTINQGWVVLDGNSSLVYNGINKGLFENMAVYMFDSTQFIANVENTETYFVNSSIYAMYASNGSVEMNVNDGGIFQNNYIYCPENNDVYGDVSCLISYSDMAQGGKNTIYAQDGIPKV